ncbi:hypothetical protein, partial [Streptomyces sp. NPDC006324]|uniref:hypothetical protein n=1 Tax=Streptomyces sp. NPDC006324 TaxID=3156751 RepID=UPI0033B49111
LWQNFCGVESKLGGQGWSAPGTSRSGACCGAGRRPVGVAAQKLCQNPFLVNIDPGADRAPFKPVNN